MLSNGIRDVTKLRNYRLRNSSLLCNPLLQNRILLTPSRDMTMKAAAEILEIPIDSKKEEIKLAYREKARLYHPDNKLSGDHDKFMKLTEANDVLSKSAYRFKNMADKGSRKGKFVMNRGYMCPEEFELYTEKGDSSPQPKTVWPEGAEREEVQENEVSSLAHWWEYWKPPLKLFTASIISTFTAVYTFGTIEQTIT